MTHVLTVAIALITFPSNGQANGTLADLGPAMNLLNQQERASLANGHVKPITDDGRKGDELQLADQLMIAFRGEERSALSVEIYNEEGRCVQQHAFTRKPGSNTLPIDVNSLAAGRYAVRVNSGANTHISRFRRE